MCLIAHRTVNSPNGGSNIPNAVIEFNGRINPDGFGIAWRDPKKGLLSKKFAPKDFGDFKKFLKKIDKQTSIEYVAHWRKATHGPACYDLSHPFEYKNDGDGDVLVFHNGIIDIDTTPTESDTEVFVKRILARMPNRWWAESALLYLVEEAISWSRLLIMTAKETVRINESSWEVQNGIWYSTTPVPKGYSANVTPMYAFGTNPSHQKTVATDGGGWRVVSEGELVDDMENEWEEDPDIIYATNDTWTHMGHVVHPINGNLNEEGECICEKCNTTGKFYVVNGRKFCDLRHDFDSDFVVGSRALPVPIAATAN